MLHVYKNGTRRGVIRAIQCYAEVSNIMLTYNKSKETLDIVHLDCNSQYGWALSKAFLYGGFEYTEDISMFTCNYIKNSQKQ